MCLIHFFFVLFNRLALIYETPISSSLLVTPLQQTGALTTEPSLNKIIICLAALWNRDMHLSYIYCLILQLLHLLTILKLFNETFFCSLYFEYIGAENHLFRACCNALQPMADTMRHAGLLTHRQLVIRSTFKYHASCRARAGISNIQSQIIKKKFAAGFSSATLDGFYIMH